MCDGAITNNYPLAHLSEQERRETLGLLLQVIVQPLETIELTDMMARPLDIFIQESINLAMADYPDQTLLIRMPKTYSVDFGMDAERKHELMDMGLKAAKEFLKKLRRPMRRYSVG
jgi:predicted acylesterase/phospholipase RssA